MFYALPAPQVPVATLVSPQIVEASTVDQPLAIAGIADSGDLIAQITPANDGTNTTVNRIDNEILIEGGRRSGDLNNLFHSFEQFNLSPGEIANFIADPQLRNVLVRVVGSDPSLINGLLRLSEGNANLFFMNPAGIVFGRQAQLDVPANFLATTATGIGFGDDTWFSAAGDNSYSSLIGDPESLAFAIARSGVIINSGDLAVSPGQSLTLVGDLIIDTGTLSAPDGQVVLAAVPGESLVRLSREGQLLSLEFSPLTEDSDRPHPWISNIANLPALLTDSSIRHATGVTLHGDGTVVLSGSKTGLPPDSGNLFILTDYHLTEPDYSYYTVDNRPALIVLWVLEILEIAPTPEYYLGEGEYEYSNNSLSLGESYQEQETPEPLINQDDLSTSFSTLPNHSSLEAPEPSILQRPYSSYMVSNITVLPSPEQDSASAPQGLENLYSLPRAITLYPEPSSVRLSPIATTTSEVASDVVNELDQATREQAQVPPKPPSLDQDLVDQFRVYEAVGNYRRSIEILRDGLSLVQDENELAAILSNLGAMYGAEGDYDQAVETYQEGLRLARQNNLRPVEGHIRLNLSSAYLVLGEILTAEQHLRESLAIADEQDDPPFQARVLSNLGIVYSSYGQHDQAIDLYHQALAIAQELADQRLQARTLNNLGYGLFMNGRLDEAERVLRDAIAHLEQIRPVDRDQDNISVFDTQVLTYRLLEQVLVEKGDIENALVISEQGRARAFVDRLSYQSALGADQDNQSAEIDTNPSLEQIRRIARDRNATIVQYSIESDPNFRYQGRQRGPISKLRIWVVQPDGSIHMRTANLSNTSLQSLIQNGLLSAGIRTARGAETEIQVGDRVRRHGEPSHWNPYQVIAIDPDTDKITLTHTDFPILGPVDRSDLYPYHPHVREGIPRFRQLHALLIDPIQDLLPADPNDHVIIIPTEELFLVPFPALQADDGSYLIEHHTLTTSPAIQVLDFTAQRQRELARLAPDDRTDALVVGNPSPMPNYLSRLTYAEQEAQTIAALLNTQPLLGAAATETAVRERLARARIIHLATHGLFNEADPFQSAIALAPDAYHDGLLTAEELNSMAIAADLVVLSACATGQGQITGDGVLGLSRSLLASGTPSALVSLWQVPDNTTSTLMTLFYQYQRTEPTYAHALRQAMLSTLRQNPHPHQWAAFTLLGEAGQIRQSNIPPKK